LGFLAITHQPTPPQLLLIEEPENGVHFASLKDIVAALKKVSEDGKTQVFVTTHSPYLLDLVEPEEVLMFEKAADGSVNAKRMSEFPDMADMKKNFMTGEIWTNLLNQEPAGKEAGEQ
jgi:predicted ATPase